jgi:hypothetical protein
MDLVEAYKWINLAATRASGGYQQTCANGLDELENAPLRRTARTTGSLKTCSRKGGTMAARARGNAPKQITWIICLVLYLVALLAHLDVVRMDRGIAEWSWIIGYGLLLIAVQVRGL